MSLAVSSSSDTSWNKRPAALRNVPPVLRLVWDAAPKVVTSGIALRLVSALIPVAPCCGGRIAGGWREGNMGFEACAL